MKNINFELRIATILLFVTWQLYWIMTEKKADREKPKKRQATLKSNIERRFVFVQGMILMLQLFGVFTFFPLPDNLYSKTIGFLLVLVGIGIGILARNTLGTNWAHAAEYQIKTNHELITKGIYQYSRNPIYLGLLIAITGAEIVVGSYLFILFFLLNFMWIYLQSKREERILLAHFGKQYEVYRNQSKLLIPFIF